MATENDAATKIQALYRGHSWRCDPANEDILEELHNRLENLIMGGAMTDGAAALAAQTTESAKKVAAKAKPAKTEAAAPESEAEFEKSFMNAMKSNMGVGGDETNKKEAEDKAKTTKGAAAKKKKPAPASKKKAPPTKKKSEKKPSKIPRPKKDAAGGGES